MTQSHNICIIFTIHFRQIGRQINRQIDRSCCVRLIFYMHIIQDGFMIKKQRINSFIDKQNILKHKINHNFCKKILINLINGPFFFKYWKTFFPNYQTLYTGLPTKKKTSDTICLVRFDAFRVPCRPKLAYFCAQSIMD